VRNLWHEYSCFTRLTVCVTCVWAGVDSVWEQEKLEARKMLENAAESHTSGVRCVGRWCLEVDNILNAILAFPYFPEYKRTIFLPFFATPAS